MNIRLMAIVLGAAGALALGSACKVEGGGGVGGDGGDDGDGGKDASSSSGADGGGGMAPCANTCIDKTTELTWDWCEGVAQTTKDAYDTYWNCICSTDAAVGKCTSVCGENTCKGDQPSGECATCVQDTTDKGCGTENKGCNDA